MELRSERSERIEGGSPFDQSEGRCVEGGVGEGGGEVVGVNLSC